MYVTYLYDYRLFTYLITSLKLCVNLYLFILFIIHVFVISYIFVYKGETEGSLAAFLLFLCCLFTL